MKRGALRLHKSPGFRFMHTTLTGPCHRGGHARARAPGCRGRASCCPSCGPPSPWFVLALPVAVGCACVSLDVEVRLVSLPNESNQDSSHTRLPPPPQPHPATAVDRPAAEDGSQASPGHAVPWKGRREQGHATTRRLLLSKPRRSLASPPARLCAQQACVGLARAPRPQAAEIEGRPALS